MTTLYFVLGILLLLLSILPKVPHSHWIFRTPDFGKIQVSILLVITLLIGFLFTNKNGGRLAGCPPFMAKSWSRQGMG